MKKIMLWIVGIILILVIIYFVSPGFMKNTSAIINDYRVSDDGKEITFNVGVSSSVGYIRDVRVHQQHGGKLYLECYSAFGGLNGSIGAKDTFTVSLDEDTSVIAVYRGSNCYKEVLVKDEDGTWQRAKQ